LGRQVDAAARRGLARSPVAMTQVELHTDSLICPALGQPTHLGKGRQAVGIRRDAQSVREGAPQWASRSVARDATHPRARASSGEPRCKRTREHADGKGVLLPSCLVTIRFIPTPPNRPGPSKPLVGRPVT
jgi:hypothetical protein